MAVRDELIQARILAHSGQILQAAELFKKLIDLEDSQAMVELAVLYVTYPRVYPHGISEAQKLLEQAIANGNRSAYLNLAILFLMKKELSNAEYFFNESIYAGEVEAIEPLLSLMSGQKSNLRDLYKKTVKDQSLINMRKLAHLLREKRRFVGADFWYSKVIKAGDLSVYGDLAIMYYRDLHDMKKFESLMGLIISQNPYQAHLIRANYLYEHGKYSSALEFFHRALSTQEKSTAPIIGIKLCYDKVHDPGGFIEWLKFDENQKYLPNLLAIASNFRSKLNHSRANEWSNFASQSTAVMATTDVVPEIKESPPEVFLAEISTQTQLTLDKSQEKYEDWLISGEDQISAAFIHQNSKFLHTLFELGREFCPMIGNWFGTQVNEEWLDEILSKYEDQQSLQTLDPQWPIRFENSELQILVSVEGQWIRGWVGRANIGGIVAIRIKDFDIQTALPSNDRNFVIGVLVAFFLDRTISHINEMHPHFEIQQGGIIFSTTQFNHDVQKTRTGERKPVQSHKVAGYCRTLPAGYQPSPEAVSRAPIYVRRNLKPNQTFVRGHQRNGPVIGETILRYLQTNSNLADAVGTAKS